MSSLTKTTVYVDEGDYQILKRIARKQQRKTAAVVRDAITQYARRRGGSRRPRSLGVVRSGRGDLSERAEKLLSGLGRR